MYNKIPCYFQACLKVLEVTETFWTRSCSFSFKKTDVALDLLTKAYMLLMA